MWRDLATSLRIGPRLVGPGEPLFVIAEIGLNHGGSLDRALAMVDRAAEAGASAVKLQTITAKALVAPSCPAPAHVAEPSLRAFFARFELNEDAHRAVAERARARGLAFMATPFSLEAVEMLERVGVDAFKIASGDLTWDQLIRRAARSHKPVVISTGMASLSETAHAVACARLGGAAGLALLHCVSAYPVPRGGENLRAIATLADAFHVPVGLSDHGDDAFAAPVAVALGASLYERHFVLEAADGSVDAAVSSTPEALSALVAAAARAAGALGTGEKACTPDEAVNVTASRRALCAARALPAGATVHPDDVVALRPAAGLAPGRIGELIGVTIGRAVAAGAPFLEGDVASARESRSEREVA